MELTNLSAVQERTRFSRTLGIVSLILTFALALIVFLTGPVNQLLEKRKENLNSLLDISEDVRFTAKRTLRNFEKYIPSAVSFLCFLLCSFALILFWKNSIFGVEDLKSLGSMTPKSPINLAFLSAMIAVFSFFGGVFLIGQSRLREFRYLRPIGAWLVAGSIVMALCTISALFLAYGKDGFQVWVEKIIFFCDAVLTVEFLINFVIEFYRPRSLEETRPVYESRFLSIFTEPGGVVRNITDSLDYQFGFKVSKTWIFVFLQKSIIPAFIIWALVFWLFTSIAEIFPGEIGIRERFGAVLSKTESLQPGVHLKLPWPFERIVRVPVDIVRSVTIGSRIDPKKANDAQIVLWTGQHYLREDPFLVAIRQADGQRIDSKSFPVSILEVSLPVFFTAKKEAAYDFAFNYDDLSKALLVIGQAEATQYFASTDFITDISSGREQVAKQLKARIQASADKLGLGIRLVSVNMHDAHPPVGQQTENGQPSPTDVASAFQDVVCAQEESKTMYSEAIARECQILEGAKVSAMQILANAEAYRNSKAKVAAADSFRFRKQMNSYRRMPEMFRLRTYLDFLENDCSGLRKYIVSAKIPVRNYMLNMEEKPSLDLLDTDLSAMGK